MRELVVVVAVVVAFAALVTAHVAIAVGLLSRPPRWRAPLAFVVAPLAPVFAWREHMRVRAGVWIAALALYAAARVLAAMTV